MIAAHCYIGGTWTEGQARETATRLNPADLSETVGTYPLAGAADVDAAVRAARAALPAWRAMAAPARGELLFRAAGLLEREAGAIAELLTREMGKPIGEAEGELKRGAALLRYYAGEGMRAVGEVYPASDGRSLLYTNRVPIGVVGVVTPWNFPVAIPLWKIAPALAYGNTVVWKPAEDAGITGYRLMRILAEAGLPEGVVNFVTGAGGEAGEALVAHPGVDALTFTGSNAVGKRVALEAVGRGAKYQLEMGGKNPSIVAADADLELAAELTLSAAMRSAGQKCTATSRVIVEREIVPVFTELLVAKARSLKLSNPLARDCVLGPVVNGRQNESIVAAIRRGTADGARLLTGGGPPRTQALASGYYIEPTLFDRVDPGSELSQQELFGPVLAIVAADGLEQALAIANDVKYGLSAAIFTKDLDRMFRFLRTAQAGMLKINGETAGVEPHAPFGGIKQSSSHSREQGRAAIEFYTSVQTIAVTPTE
ncbi:aldehyde dehydrogenase family protein [Cohnella sp. 56]|uniref:aldehyde dehydrogenase family protein n=1 Tax=Cohnella sp. 56 TaxID=3113722 RepID=UPI0030E957A0